MADSDGIKIVARNRKARFDYEIRDKIEAGIELRGQEVKSIRAGKLNLSDAYAVIESGQVWLKKLHISPYKMAADTLDPIRTRRLLLHKREIRKLTIQTDQRGLALIPLTVYFKKNIVKIELGLAIGRKKYDKRQAIAKAESDRSLQRATKKDY